jgi:hypothetical protein
MSKMIIRAAGVALLAVSSLGLAARAHAAPATPTCALYSVTLTGQADGGFGAQAFAVPEWVAMRIPGVGANPVEFVITNFPLEIRQLDAADSLNDRGAPVGSLELMSNSLYANNQGTRWAKFPQARVTRGQVHRAGDLIRFQVDPTYLGDEAPPNAFISSGQSMGNLGGIGVLPGLGNLSGMLNASGAASGLNNYYLMTYRGDGYLFFPTADFSTIQGQVRLQGTSLDFDPSVQGTYVATLQGRFRGTVACQ